MFENIGMGLVVIMLCVFVGCKIEVEEIVGSECWLLECF